jgi:PIN domain nuclease of toxin-antitoxin system
VRLLLDTHIWLWSHLQPENLAGRVASALLDPENELWLSPISVWELLLLADKGRVAVSTDPSAWVDAALAKAPMIDAPLNREVALRARSVRIAHEDPADRFLAATSEVYDLTLVTADRLLLAGRGYRKLANR